MFPVFMMREATPASIKSFKEAYVITAHYLLGMVGVMLIAHFSYIYYQEHKVQTAVTASGVKVQAQVEIKLIPVKINSYWVQSDTEVCSHRHAECQVEYFYETGVFAQKATLLDGTETLVNYHVTTVKTRI